MHKKQWLKIVGIVELLVLAIISAVFLVLLIAVIFNNDQKHGANYVLFFLMLMLPIILLLFAMGMTAYRQHESAVVMQFLGVALLIVIPLILFI